MRYLHLRRFCKKTNKTASASIASSKCFGHLGRYETKGTKIPLVLRSPRWPRQIQTSTTTGAESFVFFPNVKAHLHFGENCARLVWFKEQKYFAFFKHTQFLPYYKHGVNEPLMVFRRASNVPR
jgi:hypothetical protein